MDKEHIDILIEILEQLISEKNEDELLRMLAKETICADAFGFEVPKGCYSDCESCWKQAIENGGQVNDTIR